MPKHSSHSQDAPQLVLPDSIQPLFAAFEREDIDVLIGAGARLGGGTVLAARWNNHRRSTDLDFFIPRTRFDSLKPLLMGLLRKLEIRLAAPDPPTQSPDVDTLLQLNTQAGAIDLVGMETLSTRRAHWLNSDEWIATGTHGPLRTLTTAGILHGKLENRILRLLERDIYDVAYAARHHPDDLTDALYNTSPRTLAAYAHQLETTTIPTSTEQPVLDPNWPQWRTEAGPAIVNAIDDFDAKNARAFGSRGPEL